MEFKSSSHSELRTRSHVLHSHWDHTLLGAVCVPSFKRLGLGALGHVHGSYMGEVSIKKVQLATARA